MANSTVTRFCEYEVKNYVLLPGERNTFTSYSQNLGSILQPIPVLCRKVCGLPEACSWDSPPSEIPANLWQKLSNLYGAPRDIDLFTAGLAETPLSGAHVGPTFACIIGRQVIKLHHCVQNSFNNGNIGSLMLLTF